MKAAALLLLFLITFQVAQAQNGKIEEAWVRADSVFISNYIRALHQNPVGIEPFLQPDKKNKDNLGFGYHSVEGSMGKGYVSVFYQLIYLKVKLVSFKLAPQMPSDQRLTERYKRFYNSLFKISHDLKVMPYYFNYEGMAEPLGGYSYTNKASLKGISFLMTPFSGILYGEGGGVAFNPLPNRIIFNQVKEILEPEDYLLLLHSKNPATRLMAAEAYCQKPIDFTRYRTEIQIRIQKVYRVHPEAKTISGCLIRYRDSEALVKGFSKNR